MNYLTLDTRQNSIILALNINITYAAKVNLSFTKILEVTKFTKKHKD